MCLSAFSVIHKPEECKNKPLSNKEALQATNQVTTTEDTSIMLSQNVNPTAFNTTDSNSDRWSSQTQLFWVWLAMKCLPRIQWAWLESHGIPWILGTWIIHQEWILTLLATLCIMVLFWVIIWPEGDNPTSHYISKKKQQSDGDK